MCIELMVFFVVCCCIGIEHTLTMTSLLVAEFRKASLLVLGPLLVAALSLALWLVAARILLSEISTLSGCFA